MTTAIRFRNVFNTLGGVLTVANLPGGPGDGDDKASFFVQRPYVTADIGTGAGQTRNASGCIITQLPANANVLAVFAVTYRTSGEAGFMLDNFIYSTAILNPPAVQASLNYFLDATNCLRLLDSGTDVHVQVAAGDYTSAIIVTGIGPSWNSIIV